jgi:serine/threonine protein kinase
MALLKQMGPFEGPGEEKTARELGAKLPNNWLVISGRKLPGANRDDTDLIIVGDTQIFVLEEKSWGPKVLVDDVTWITNQRNYANPLDRISYLARRVAGLFESRIPNYKQIAGKKHIVRSGVVLSHDSLMLKFGPGFNDSELVMQLSGGMAVRRLKSEDAKSNALDSQLREQIIEILLGLSEREVGRLRIDQFETDQELPPVGKMRRFQAHDSLNRELILLCFPIADSSSMVKPSGLANVEARALAAIDDLNRSWKLGAPPIRDDINGFYVTALLFPKGATHLDSSIRNNVPQRVEGRLDAELLATIVKDAFEALSEIHDRQVIHRALCPQRIWLDRMNKVLFTDFVFPRIEGAATIALDLDDMSGDLSAPFRAPEITSTLSDATRASDVYSLALSLSCWALGLESVRANLETILERLSELGPLSGTLKSCLSQDAEKRPTTRQILRDFEDAAGQIEALHVESSSTSWEPGVAVGDDGRYTLKLRLGKGGSATSWLASDSNRKRQVVLKRFGGDRDPVKSKEIYDSAFKELRNAEELRNHRIAQVLDISSSDEEVYLVYEFIEGNNLRELFQGNRRESLKDRDCAKIATQALEGLSYLHQNGLRHGDVTPTNIIVSENFEVRLIDFGLTGRNEELVFAITADFASPQLLETKRATDQSDLYGLSATMLSLMLGVPSINSAILAAISEYTIPQREEERWGTYGTSLMQCFLRAIEDISSGNNITAESLIEEIAEALEAKAADGQWVENETVDSLRLLIRNSILGNPENRGIDSEFARQTYVGTRLDAELPKLLKSKYRVVILTGNPGDGKTSALQMLLAYIKNQPGAKVIDENVGGWTSKLGSKTIIAINDASESQGERSSDMVLLDSIGSLDPAALDDRITFIAANDGRILQFFKDNSDHYPRLFIDISNQLKEQAAPSGNVLLIDLKKRALALPGDEENLVLKLIGVMTSNDKWAVCGSCNARLSCPIKANVDVLRQGGAAAVSELALISHLRRRKRFTLRDIRSTIAWIITSDKSCKDVFEATKNSLDLRRRHGTGIWDLAFSPAAGDPVIDDWAQVDPALFPSPANERTATDRSLLKSATKNAASQFGEIQRKIFFNGYQNNAFIRESTQAYKYISDYIGNSGRTLDEILSLVLSGVSKLVGSPGYRGDGLAIAGTDKNSVTAVLKIVPRGSFELVRPKVQGKFVESFDDLLVLKHDSGTELPVTLDLLELMLRAASGEIFNSAGATSLIQDLETFTTQLRRQPSQEVLIFNGAGEPIKAVKSEDLITLSTGPNEL